MPLMYPALLSPLIQLVLLTHDIAVKANMKGARIFENHDYHKNPVDLYILQ
jgi:hypothetical protein